MRHDTLNASGRASKVLTCPHAPQHLLTAELIGRVLTKARHDALKGASKVAMAGCLAPSFASSVPTVHHKRHDAHEARQPHWQHAQHRVDKRSPQCSTERADPTIRAVGSALPMLYRPQTAAQGCLKEVCTECSSSSKAHSPRNGMASIAAARQSADSPMDCQLLCL